MFSYIDWLNIQPLLKLDAIYPINTIHEELLYLKNFLIHIHDVDDVRDILRDTFYTDIYHTSKDIGTLIMTYITRAGKG